MKTYLENGDGVVADHVGATEGLGEEEEDEDDHGEKDRSLHQEHQLVFPRITFLSGFLVKTLHQLQLVLNLL